MKRDELQHPTQVRLPRALKDRLATAAKNFGLTSSELIRRAIEWKLPDWEQTGVLTIESAIPNPRTRAVRRAATAAVVIAALLAASHSSPQPVEREAIVCAGE